MADSLASEGAINKGRAWGMLCYVTLDEEVDGDIVTWNSKVEGCVDKIIERSKMLGSDEEMENLLTREGWFAPEGHSM